MLDVCFVKVHNFTFTMCYTSHGIFSDSYETFDCLYIFISMTISIIQERRTQLFIRLHNKSSTMIFFQFNFLGVYISLKQLQICNSRYIE